MSLRFRYRSSIASVSFTSPPPVFIPFSQPLFIRQTAQLLLYDLLAQPPQVLAQFLVLRLFGGVGDFAVGDDLQGSFQKDQ